MTNRRRNQTFAAANPHDDFGPSHELVGSGGKRRFATPNMKVDFPPALKPCSARLIGFRGEYPGGMATLPRFALDRLVAKRRSRAISKTRHGQRLDQGVEVTELAMAAV